LKHSRRAVSPKRSQIISSGMNGRFEMRRFGYLICLRQQDLRVRAYEPPEQEQTVSEPGLTSCSVCFLSIPRKPQHLLRERVIDLMYIVLSVEGYFVAFLTAVNTGVSG
jgi:hypothetical protein